MHFLPLEHIDQLHLLLECGQQLVPLSLEPLVVVAQPVQVPSHVVALASLIHFGFPQEQLVFLHFFEGSVQLRLLVALVLGLFPHFQLSALQVTTLVLQLPFQTQNALLLLGDLSFKFRCLQSQTVDLVLRLFVNHGSCCFHLLVGFSFRQL